MKKPSPSKTVLSFLDGLEVFLFLPGEIIQWEHFPKSCFLAFSLGGELQVVL